MRKISCFIISITLLLFYGSCEEDNDSFPSGRVVSNANSADLFEEVNMTITLQNDSGQYILVPKIDSIVILVNNELWSITSSETVDTSIFKSEAYGDFKVLNDQFEYLNFAKEKNETVDLVTLKDISEFLNQSLDLKNGEHICTIVSFEITDEKGIVQKFYPYKSKSFEVREGYASAFVGHFEFIIE